MSWNLIVVLEFNHCKHNVINSLVDSVSFCSGLPGETVSCSIPVGKLFVHLFTFSCDALRNIFHRYIESTIKIKIL